MAARWVEVLGDHPEREAILSTLSHSLCETTAASYGNHWSRFVRWCEEQRDQPNPLPASTSTVLRWLAADVCARNTVLASSLQPYLSSLNRVHRDLDFDEPAIGHLVQQFRRGLAHRQADQGRDAERVYLPPPVVERALVWALALDLSCVTARGRQHFRAPVATVLTFCLFARGATGSAMDSGHVRRSEVGVTITLDREKGKRTRTRARTFTIPPGAIPGLEELLAKWESFRGEVPSDVSYWRLPGERARRFPPSAIDGWLRAILDHLDARPPPGELWSGHSLRKGAASGAAAEGVSLERICYCGNWSVRSKSVHDYVDPTCPQTAACRRFFGWLRPS